MPDFLLQDDELPKIDSQELAAWQTSENRTLLDAVASGTTMIVFLRHFGCTFCREALDDISKRQAQIKAEGANLIFVHMSDNETAERYFKRYEISNPVHISDPECRLYQIFGLVKGNLNQLFGLRVWMRGFEAGIVNGKGVGVRQIGDGFQMPGVFVFQEGHLNSAFIHKFASDRPDYEQLMHCCKPDHLQTVQPA